MYVEQETINFIFGHSDRSLGGIMTVFTDHEFWIGVINKSNDESKKTIGGNRFRPLKFQDYVLKIDPSICYDSNADFWLSEEIALHQSDRHLTNLRFWYRVIHYKEATPDNSVLTFASQGISPYNIKPEIDKHWAYNKVPDAEVEQALTIIYLAGLERLSL